MITTFSSRIALLRVALGEGLLHRRRPHDASFRRLLGTLFHHARPATSAVGAVPIAMIESAFGRSLMTAATLAQCAATPLGAAWLRAVPITVVAHRAEEEHLPTLDDRANNEAERVHVPASGTL
jgi:hypothetical protein